MKIRELTQEELVEESFVDLTYAILQETHETKTYPELVAEIEKLLGLSKEDMKARLVQFYTDMNIDGRFLILGENRWGLREWYPVEQIEEESAPTVKARKKKAKVSDEDFDDMDLEMEDELEFDDFDEADEDEDEDDDTNALIIPPVSDEEEEEEEVIDFDVDVDDDDDEVDVAVLVEDIDGNIIDEDEEDDDLEDDLDEDLK